MLLVSGDYRLAAIEIPVLLAMIMADDEVADPRARLYWGGWENLALALGYTADDLDLDPGRRRSAEVMVSRALRQLVSKGYIERRSVLHAGRGRRQTYRLALGMAKPPSPGLG